MLRVSRFLPDGERVKDDLRTTTRGAGDLLSIYLSCFSADKRIKVTLYRERDEPTSRAAFFDRFLSSFGV